MSGSSAPTFVGGSYNWFNPNYIDKSVETLQQTPDPQGAKAPEIQDGGGKGPEQVLVGVKDSVATKVTEPLADFERTFNEAKAESEFSFVASNRFGCGQPSSA